MKAYFQRLPYLLGALLLISSCDDDDGSTTPIGPISFTQLGLDNLKVYELVLYGDALFAATNDGVFLKKIQSPTPFTRVGLQGRNVLDIVAFSPDHLIATTGIRGAVVDDPGIHETLDGGTTWNRSDFGEDGSLETAHSFSQHPSEKGIVYGTGNAVIAKSSDYGRNWDAIWGNWGAFASGAKVAKLNPFRQTDLWYGGQGGIENGYLGYLRNEQPFQQWDDLVDNPTVAVEVAFSGEQGQNILVGFEGALMKTVNNGDDWQQVIDGHTNGLRFFYSIEHSKEKNNHVYAGGWLKGEEKQSLVLYISKDAGDTWEAKTFEEEQSGGILSMKAVSERTEEKIFVGLDGGGVYEITVK
jgi:photosystem II stability/assembly factor-like uncharacterized protein